MLKDRQYLIETEFYIILVDTHIQHLPIVKKQQNRKQLTYRLIHNKKIISQKQNINIGNVCFFIKQVLEIKLERNRANHLMFVDLQEK